MQGTAASRARAAATRAEASPKLKERDPLSPSPVKTGLPRKASRSSLASAEKAVVRAERAVKRAERALERSGHSDGGGEEGVEVLAS